MTPLPRPSQDDINRAQGEVNERQGDLNEKQGDINARVANDRADRSEAKAARGVEQRDAEHADQAATNEASSARADVSEGAAAVADVRREDQFDAQAVQNERREGQFDRQTQTNANQAGLNADQLIINADAVRALGDIGIAAKAVTNLLEQNVKRGRYWTAALGVVLAIVIGIGTVVWFQARTSAATNRRQRDGLAAQTAALRTQAADVADTRAKSCTAAIKRTEAIKTELTFLVDYAIGENNKSATLRKFKADYPAHLAVVIPPVIC
jgi:hypothetical protein